jgi:transcriptional regulator
MYLPASFAVSDEKTLDWFIERYEFATLTSSSSTGLVASHIPIMLRRSAGKAVLVGHVARANDQWRQFDGNAEALAVFHGPHAYVSPTWYATAPAVPTWNYAAVHVYGKPRAREEDDFTAAVLRDLVAKHEASRVKPWRTEDLARDFFERLAKAIVAFEMPIDRIEGKFKLGQNRSQDDRVGMLEGLDAEKSADAAALAAFIRETANPMRIPSPPVRV